MQLIKIYTQPRVLVVLLLGVLSGLPLALTGSTVSIWLTEVGVSKASIGFFAMVGTPYALKFLWAPLVDQLQLPFIGKLGRRRSWLIFSQLILVLALLGMAATPPALHTILFALLALCVAIASATQDIVIDAYRVELLPAKEQGAGAAAIVCGYRIGMLFSGAGALFMAEVLPWGVVYMVMAVLVVLGGVVLFFRPEPKKIKRAKYADIAEWMRAAIVEPFRDFMTHKGWWLILLFVMAFKLGDALAGVMTGPFLIELGFTKTTIATIVKTYGLVATLLGTFLGGLMIARIRLFSALLFCGIVQMFANSLLIILAMKGASEGWLTIAITAENLCGGMGTAAFVAYLSSLCRVHYTATQYALLSSLASAGRTWLSAGSGLLAQSLGWVGFFSFTTLAALPGLILLVILSRNAKPR